MSRSARPSRLASLLFALSLSLPPALLALPAAPALASPGEWHINSPQTIENQTYTSETSIIIDFGGTLTVRNATLLFNLTKEGELNLTVNSGGSLFLENAAVRPSPGADQIGLHYNFLVSGHLEARRADISGMRGDAGLGGLEIDGGNAVIEDSLIHHNRYYGLFLRSGAPVVRRTTFENNVVAISVLPGASPLLEDLTIRNSTSFGLKIADASPVVRNLTVTGSSNFAVGAVGSVLDIEGCSIAGGQVGIDAALGTTGKVEGCEFLSLSTGVRAADSPIGVANCSFLGLALGVNATRSAVEIADNRFSEVAVGVRVREPVEGVFGGEGVNNSFTGAGTGFELFAANFFLSNNSYGPLATGSRVFHTVTLLVVDTAGAAVARARVNITAADGSRVFTGVTNETGAVSATLEQFRELGNGTRANMTPHAVRIESAGLVTETTVNATSDKTERITLAAPAAADTTTLGVPRATLLLIGVVFALAAGLSVASVRLRARRAAAARHAKTGSAPGRRRGPRAGR